MLDNSSPQNTCAIYIHHTSGVHYDVVLDVELCSSETPHNLGAKQKRKLLSNNNSFVIKNIPNKVSKLDKVFQSNLSHEPISMSNKCKVKESIPCQISKKMKNIQWTILCHKITNQILISFTRL